MGAVRGVGGVSTSAAGLYQNQNQPVRGGGGEPAITRLTPCWNSRSYCFVLGMKTNHCNRRGMPICAARQGILTDNTASVSGRVVPPLQ